MVSGGGGGDGVRACVEVEKLKNEKARGLLKLPDLGFGRLAEVRRAARGMVGGLAVSC